jgi:DNA polymerase
LEKAILGCTKCPNLVQSRTQVVFGIGNRSAELMFVGEAPGADEDKQGEPFVGRAGQLLTKIIEAMGFARSDIFIANVLKCRPDMPPGESGNRKPRMDEMATCLPWLREQISLVKPRVMVALGATAAEGLLGETRPMRELRGNWLDFQGTPVMVTYHPAYLLRNQTIAEKRKVWEDMLLVLEKLGHPISEKQRRFFTQAA